MNMSMVFVRTRRLATRPLVGFVSPASTTRIARPTSTARFNSSQAAANAEIGVSPSLKLIGVYVGVSLAAMASIARYKNRDAAEEEVRPFLFTMRCI